MVSRVPQHALASRWVRLGAATIDGFILFLLFIPVFFLFFFDRMDEDGNMAFVDNVLMFLIASALFLLVNGALIYRRGQTVGKLALKIKVVDLAGNRVSGNKYYFVRELPITLVQSTPVGNIVGLIDSLLIFREERNCLHDDLAQTRVVKVEYNGGDELQAVFR